MKKIVSLFGLSTIILLVLVFVNINSGSVSVSVKEIIDIILNNSKDETSIRIIMDIRLPRVISAILLGGALAVSGFLLQTFFGNPIAGPYILGISSGAKLTVALTLILFLQRGIKITSVGMIISAFAGSLIAMVFVLVVAKKVPSMSILIVCGIMIGYICSAITDFVVTFADDSNIVNLHNWSMGSLSGMNWENVKYICIIIIS